MKGMHLNQKQQPNSLYGEISVNVTLGGGEERTQITDIFKQYRFLLPNNKIYHAAF